MEKFGRYQLEEKLGQGGMGVVYRAFDTMLERTVALKVVLPTVLDDELRERLFREARAAGHLAHKNIVTIYDLGEWDARPYLAMEFLEGEDLQRRLSRTEKMSLAYKLDLAIEICDALGYAHAHGVIHRDIKPANIFIMDSGGAKLVDFGLARLMTSQLTRSNMLMGTLNYMAPEQVRGERADQRSDIFSTGVVLYELLGGRKAFDGDTVASTLYKILQEVPEPLWKLDAALPRDAAQIVERMLAKLPDERYQTMDQVRRDLEACRDRYRAGDRSTPVPLELSPVLAETIRTRASGPLPPAPAAASSPASPQPASAPSVRHRAPIAIAAAALIVVAGTGAAWWFSNRSREPAPAPAAVAEPVSTAAAPAPAPPPVVPQPRGAERVPAERARTASIDRGPDRTSTRGTARGRGAAAETPPPRNATTGAKQPSDAAAPPAVPAAPLTTAPAASIGSPVVSAPPPDLSAPRHPASVPPPAPVAPAPVDAPAAVPAAVAQERIAALLDEYRQALEGKSLDQLKRIWPSLGGNAEAAIRQEFSHAASISVAIENPQITVTGASAQVRFVRDYSLVTVDGQHLQSTTHAVMDARKAAAGWVIGGIRFSER